MPSGSLRRASAISTTMTGRSDGALPPPQDEAEQHEPAEPGQQGRVGFGSGKCFPGSRAGFFEVQDHRLRGGPGVLTRPGDRFNRKHHRRRHDNEQGQKLHGRMDIRVHQSLGGINLGTFASRCKSHSSANRGAGKNRGSRNMKNRRMSDDEPSHLSVLCRCIWSTGRKGACPVLNRHAPRPGKLGGGRGGPGGIDCATLRPCGGAALRAGVVYRSLAVLFRFWHSNPARLRLGRVLVPS